MKTETTKLVYWVRGWLVKVPPTGRIPLVVVLYTLALVASLWLAYQIRFDFAVPAPERERLWQAAQWIIPLQLVLLLVLGQFAGLLSYFSVPDMRRLFLTLTTATVVIMSVWVSTGGQSAPPRSVVVADLMLSFLVLCAMRLFFRRVREGFLNGHAAAHGQRVGIVGAGETGAALARELLRKPHLGLRPVVFFDDDQEKWDSRLHGIPVAGAVEVVLRGAGRWNLNRVIIAIPSASGLRIREVVAVLRQARLPFETVPSMEQLASGRVKVTQIRPVEIEDLLGREPVKLEAEAIRQLLKDRVVMVTGAGGSIGSEMCRQIAAYQPRLLLMVEQCEVQLFRIEQDMIRHGYGPVAVPLIGDILDEARMREIFAEFRPELLFHAAAHKHVPLMESQAAEAIKNNTFGTMRLARWAQEFRVGHFVFISTDKAINPTSVMGATKRLAEVFLQSLSGNHWPSPRLASSVASPFGRNGHRTKFMAVRFGNVLGSSGSVIPAFKEQIAAGGPVMVTHPDITRYFMTIPEAVGLVLQSATQGQGGEIFVLDMGQPMKIVDLARQLIELSGLRPDEDIEIRFVGLRPGEKLFEELSHRGENLLPTTHPKIMRFVSRPMPFALIQDQVQELEEGLGRWDASELRLALQSCVHEYRPVGDVPVRPSRMAHAVR
jgi:FlaA1/EpsC-like NDP-sugar epimerase